MAKALGIIVIISLARALFLMPKSEPIMKSMDQHSHTYAVKIEISVLEQINECESFVINHLRTRNLPK